MNSNKNSKQSQRSGKRKSSRKLAGILCAIIVAVGGIIAAVVSIIPELSVKFRTVTPVVTPVVDVSHLYAIEKRLYRPVVKGLPLHTSLMEYYKAANRELFAHLASVVTKYKNGEEEHRGATYVMGAPGIGKSFVARSLDILESQRCILRMGDIYEWENLGFDIEERPDLATLDVSKTFNELPAIADPLEFSIRALLMARGRGEDSRHKPFIIIDDLDEIHAESSQLVLRSIEELISGDSENGFLHFVVFGRPEGFAPWLRDASQVPLVSVSKFILHGPRYSTMGDIEFFYNNYFDFKGIGKPPKKEVQDFTELVQKLPFLSHSLSNLALGNFVVEQSHLNPMRTEAALKYQLYDNLLDRNHQKNGRPARHLGDYGLILEKIAVRYAGRVDEDGFFIVGFADNVRVTRADGTPIEVRVRDVLDRSGIAFLDPVEFTTTRYRFDPLWVHAHLIERANLRHHPHR